MPTYEYVCDEGHETERRQSMSSEPLERCPAEDCDAPARRKISTGLAVHDGGSRGPDGADGAGACGPGGSGFT